MPIERDQPRGRFRPRRLLRRIKGVFEQAKHNVHSKKGRPRRVAAAVACIISSVDDPRYTAILIAARTIVSG